MENILSFNLGMLFLLIIMVIGIIFAVNDIRKQIEEKYGYNTRLEDQSKTLIIQRDGLQRQVDLHVAVNKELINKNTEYYKENERLERELDQKTEQIKKYKAELVELYKPVIKNCNSGDTCKSDTASNVPKVYVAEKSCKNCNDSREEYLLVTRDNKKTAESRYVCMNGCNRDESGCPIPMPNTLPCDKYKASGWKVAKELGLGEYVDVVG